jgi:hypothetical protein
LGRPDGKRRKTDEDDLFGEGNNDENDNEFDADNNADSPIKVTRLSSKNKALGKKSEGKKVEVIFVFNNSWST